LKYLKILSALSTNSLTNKELEILWILYNTGKEYNSEANKQIRELGISRSNVYKYLKVLRTKGYLIENKLNKIVAELPKKIVVEFENKDNGRK